MLLPLISSSWYEGRGQTWTPYAFSEHPFHSVRVYMCLVLGYVLLVFCQSCILTSRRQVDHQGWHLGVKEIAVYWGCLPLKAAMCVGVIILQTNKSYSSSCSSFFFFSLSPSSVVFCFFFFPLLLIFSHSSFPALFLYLLFSHCNVPSPAVMKMCDKCGELELDPLPCSCLPLLVLPSQILWHWSYGEGVEAKEASRYQANAALTLPISVHL